MYQYAALAPETLEQLSGKGVFFTVKDGDRVNTMTIGWGSLSQYWGQEIFIAPIRFSRYSFELLKNAKTFTISVPVNGQMDQALKVCGSVSGRNGDKLAAAGLTLLPGQAQETPVIDGCDIYYECEILYASDLDKAALPADLAERWYASGDMHRLFFGKIVAAYRK